MEKPRSPLVSIPPFGRNFQGMRVYRPMTSPLSAQRERRTSRVAEHPCRARFRFARQDHCRSATTCRFSTSGCPRDSAGTQTVYNSLTSALPWLSPIRFNSKKKFHLSSDLVLMVNKHIVVTASDPLNADLRAALLDTGNETAHHRSHFFLSLRIGSGRRVAIKTKRRLFDPGVVQRSECIAFHHLAVHVWRCAPLNAAIRVNQERVSHAGFKGAAGRSYRKHAVQKAK